MSSTPIKPAASPQLSTASSEAAVTSGDLAPEDFYLDGRYLVFTAAYHLKRGYCCNSDCRHCPYRDPAHRPDPA